MTPSFIAFPPAAVAAPETALSAELSHGPGYWDARYTGESLIWSAGPNQFVASELADLPPGTALDLACGEGRNAIWLAEGGWTVTGVDFSPVALAKAKRMAAERGAEVDLVEQDVLEWRPPDGGFDLVLLAYLQLAVPARDVVLATAASAVAARGTLLFVGHDADNLDRGFGGPRDRSVLYAAGEVAGVLEAHGLCMEKAGQVVRDVETDEGTRQAIDTLVRTRRTV